MAYNNKKYSILTDIVCHYRDDNDEDSILYCAEIQKAQRSISYRIGDFQLISLLDSGVFGHVCLISICLSTFKLAVLSLFGFGFPQNNVW